MHDLHDRLHQDNYGYILMDETTKKAAAIDPVEVKRTSCMLTPRSRPVIDLAFPSFLKTCTQPDKILAAADALGATITVVLTTHKHWCVRACVPAGTQSCVHTHAEPRARLPLIRPMPCDDDNANEPPTPCRDHAGGNNALKKRLPDVPVLGGAIDQARRHS